MRYRRPVLGLVLGAIAVTAVLGLYAILVPGEFGDVQAKVLATSATISGTSVVLLAFVPAWERRLVRWLPAVGAALTLISFALLVVLIWAEPDSETYGKVMGTTMIPAAWSVLVCLLALATLPRRYRWAFLTAAGLTLALATLAVAAIWTEPDSTPVARLGGALAVLSAAFVLTVPVLHRASRGELAVEGAAPTGGFCPRCGCRVPAPATDETAACNRCGARFTVEYVNSSESSPVALRDSAHALLR